MGFRKVKAPATQGAEEQEWAQSVPGNLGWAPNSAPFLCSCLAKPTPKATCAVIAQFSPLIYHFIYREAITFKNKSETSGLSEGPSHASMEGTFEMQ